MSNLLEKIKNKQSAFLGDIAGTERGSIDQEYALSKVIARKLGKDPRPQSGWVDNFDLILIEDTEANKRTPEQQQRLIRGITDLTLVVTHKGIIKTFSHIQLEEYIGHLGMIERGHFHKIRPYWFGYGFNINADRARNEVDLQATISNRLIADITDMVENYKLCVTCLDENKALPAKFRKEVVGTPDGQQVTKRMVNKGSWLDVKFYDWCRWYDGTVHSMEETTYLFRLIDSLAQGLPVPSDIPMDSLTKREREILESKFVQTPEVKTEKPKTASTKKETETNV